MKRWAIKKADDSIGIFFGADPSIVLADGDVVVGEAPELPTNVAQEAWKEEDGAIVVDLDKAREIKLDEIRVERDRLLAESDAEWVEKSSKGEDVSDLNTRKQALRDLPAAVESALASESTAEDIAAYTPAWP